ADDFLNPLLPAVTGIRIFICLGRLPWWFGLLCRLHLFRREFRLVFQQGLGWRFDSFLEPHGRFGWVLSRFIPGRDETDNKRKGQQTPHCSADHCWSPSFPEPAVSLSNRSAISCCS